MLPGYAIHKTFSNAERLNIHAYFFDHVYVLHYPDRTSLLLHYNAIH